MHIFDCISIFLRYPLYTKAFPVNCHSGQSVRASLLKTRFLHYCFKFECNENSTASQVWAFVSEFYNKLSLTNYALCCLTRILRDSLVMSNIIIRERNLLFFCTNITMEWLSITEYIFSRWLLIFWYRVATTWGIYYII